MKKRAIIVLCLALVLTLIGCGNNAQSSDEHNAEYEEGYTAGYEAGYHNNRAEKCEVEVWYDSMSLCRDIKEFNPQILFLDIELPLSLIHI